MELRHVRTLAKRLRLNRQSGPENPVGRHNPDYKIAPIIIFEKATRNRFKGSRFAKLTRGRRIRLHCRIVHRKNSQAYGGAARQELLQPEPRPFTAEAKQLMNEHRKSLQLAVGEQIRLQRLSRGLSVAELARIIDVGEEELDAYERGDKRIPSSRLWDLAEFFGVPLSSFFDTFRPG